jgi:hypothetical protein
MSSTSSTRIPGEPDKFLAYMQSTDNRQLLDDPDNPGHPLYEKYSWTLAESDAWTAFRVQAEAAFTAYNTEATVNTLSRDQMFGLITEVNEYDHGLSDSHHLLDLVGIKGDLTDWEIFRVKRSTTLSDSSPTRAEELGTLKPEIALRSSSPGEHLLTVNNPDTPDSHALPPNVVFAEVYRYISTADAPPKLLKDFEQIGVAKRGLFISKFADQTFDKAKKYFAWYIARYQARDGELGLAGNELIAMIVEDGGRGIVN